MKNSLAVILCLAVSAAMPGMCQDQPRPAAPAAPPAAEMRSPLAPGGTGVVARVNGREISRRELDVAIQGVVMGLAARGQGVPADQLPRLQQDMLDELINRELMLQEGKTHPVADLDGKVAEELEQAKKQSGGDENFKKALAEVGLTDAQFAARLRDNVIVRTSLQQIVEREAKVTPDEVKAYYDKNLDRFKDPEAVRVSHIMVTVPANAADAEKTGKRAQIDAARARLMNGEAFAAVAKQVSEDKVSAANGGDLGYFPRGSMLPQLDVVAFGLKTNQVSEVITTPAGFHLLIVTDHKPGRQVPFDEVKADLERGLKNQKGMEIVRKHVADLRAAAKVEILLPVIPAPAAPTAPATGAAPAPSPAPAPVAPPAK